MDDDRDLSAAAAARFNYEPAILDDLQPDGMYILFGPRRVGKSVQLKYPDLDAEAGRDI